MNFAELEKTDDHPPVKLFGGVAEPIIGFFKLDAIGGILLLIATAVALIWANSPFSESYDRLWNKDFIIGLGAFQLDKALIHWVNDGLMAIFFLAVGLEIKRELTDGELASFQSAIFPVSAALGGMLVPAGVFLVLTMGTTGVDGWGIPMATDIAFSLGVLQLLGKRVPLGLKVFLTAFAIVDDIGAVVIITFFYTHGMAPYYLIGSAVVLGLLTFLNLTRNRYIPLYVILGILLWLTFLKSGIHASISGVVLAFFIPSSPRIGTGTFAKRLKGNIRDLVRAKPGPSELTLSAEQLHAMDNLAQSVREAQGPVQRIEHRLQGWVAYFIMPVFALANAGVNVKDFGLPEFVDPLTIGVAVGLLAGKFLGIFSFSWLSVKLKIASLPDGIQWRHILGASIMGGIGFTMSLFIANLAFHDTPELKLAKLGVLFGSFAAGIIGYLVVKATLRFEANPAKAKSGKA